MRNDLVTGNAVGGKSFRGNVGYSSPDDFRGALGSDDLFSFRRDSLGAGAAGLGLRGTSSLQYQYSYTTSNQFGNRAGQAPGGLSRLGTSTSADKTEFLPTPRVPTRVSTSEFSGLGQGWNELAPRMGTLRSTAAFNSTQGLNPSIIGQRETRTGLESLTASNLLGIRSVQARKSDLPRSQVAPVPAVNTQQKVDPKTGRIAPIDPLNPSNETGQPGDLNKEVRTAYTDLLDRLDKSSGGKTLPATRDQPGDKPGEKPIEKFTVPPIDKPGTDKPVLDKPADAPAWESRLHTLRDQLEAARTKRDAEPGSRGEKNSDAMMSKDKSKDKAGGKSSGKSRSGADKNAKNAEKNKDAANAFISDFDAETIQMIKDVAAPVNAYVVTTADKDLYSRYMIQGASLLADGMYFDAEEQFARCLAVSPGDPMASAARINSQLGAALFLSAAVNAQTLFEKHPEVIGIRYTGNTMPNPTRLATISQVLRERLAVAKKDGLAAARDAGLLLAYVGYQLSDKAMTAEGFASLEEMDDSKTDALTPLLKAVWLR